MGSAIINVFNKSLYIKQIYIILSPRQEWMYRRLPGNLKWRLLILDAALWLWMDKHKKVGGRTNVQLCNPNLPPHLSDFVFGHLTHLRWLAGWLPLQCFSMVLLCVCTLERSRLLPDVKAVNLCDAAWIINIIGRTFEIFSLGITANLYCSRLGKTLVKNCCHLWCFIVVHTEE